MEITRLTPLVENTYESPTQAIYAVEYYYSKGFELVIVDLGTLEVKAYSGAPLE